MMALGIPEFLRVRPEKNLKLGPDLSSSHCRQSLRLPSGLLLSSPVIQLQMQSCNKYNYQELVCRLLINKYGRVIETSFSQAWRVKKRRRRWRQRDPVPKNNYMDP